MTIQQLIHVLWEEQRERVGFALLISLCSSVYASALMHAHTNQRDVTNGGLSKRGRYRKGSNYSDVSDELVSILELNSYLILGEFVLYSVTS